MVVNRKHGGGDDATNETSILSPTPDYSAHSMQEEKVQNPISINEPMNSEALIQEPLHGEWLTVNKKKGIAKRIPKNKESNLRIAGIN